MKKPNQIAAAIRGPARSAQATAGMPAALLRAPGRSRAAPWIAFVNRLCRWWSPHGLNITSCSDIAFRFCLPSGYPISAGWVS
jgi:hypothetical protein